METVAHYMHFFAHPTAFLAAFVLLARSAKHGVISHLLMAGAALAAGVAALAAQNLYANFLYKESERAMSETPLGVLAFACLLFSLGAMIVPGYTPKRGAWQRFVIPSLVAVGFLVLAAAHLAKTPSLGYLGGALVCSAGGLFIFDKSGSAENPQERIGACAGFALLLAGLFTLIATLMAGQPGEALAKAEVLYAAVEIVIPLFLLIGAFSIEHTPGATAAKPEANSYAPPPPPGMADALPPAPGMTIPPPGAAVPPPGAPARPSRPARPPSRR